MSTPTPFKLFRDECLVILRDALARAFPRAEVDSLSLDDAKRPEFGELYSSVAFDLAKTVRMRPQEVAERIANRVDLSEARYVSAVRSVGGYVNFFLNHSAMSELTTKSALELDEDYGSVKSARPLRIIVEHTSANPSGPIHIGTARNSILGDCLARMLRARGHDVETHFYMDDIGRQVAIATYGLTASGVRRPTEMKGDAWIGLVYAITNTLLKIRELKSRISSLRGKVGMEGQLKRSQEELHSYAAVASELEGRNKELFSAILERVEADEDPNLTISDLSRKYEMGDPSVKRTVRKVVDECVKGFDQTLSKIGVSFDSWDWESSYVWSGDVGKVVDALRKTPYVSEVDGAHVLSTSRIVDDRDLRERLGIGGRYEISDLTLTRSDGTTLYTTRDMAYSLWKLERANRVINVIGFDQSLAQIQLKLALSVLGHEDVFDRMVHYVHELVRLPGIKMARRLGRYVTLDQVIDEAESLAYRIVSEKSGELPEDKRREIASFVATGAIRYALASVDPLKTVDFRWERVLDFEQNSGPFIQYAHARASNILARAKEEPKNPDFHLLDHELEHKLVWLVSRFPDVFIRACERLRPNLIADFANELAEAFNSYYAGVPVLKAKPEGLRDARLMLVKAIRITLRNSLKLLGIHSPDRM